MSNHNEQPVDTNLLEEMGYEHADVNMSSTRSSIVIFFVVSTVLMFAGMAAMAFFAPKMMNNSSPPPERTRKPGAEQPLIQGNATALMDMREFMASQGNATSTYGWTDRKSGHVRIPVEEAMKKTLEKGLPTRANPVDPKESE